MKNRIVMITGLLIALIFISHISIQVRANSNEYITIIIQAEGDQDGITYALDTDEPSAFSESNSFVIQAGTSHTIYMKDAAGNITSQRYEPLGSYTSDSSRDDYSYIYGSEQITLSDEADETINIDLEIGNSDSENDYYEISVDSPAEEGNGSLYSKNHLNGTDTDEQIFYALTTAEGDVFYLLVDQTQEENNVYLLNQVHNSDLAALAEEDENNEEDDEEDSLLKALTESTKEEVSIDSTEEKQKNGMDSRMIILVFIVIGGAAYYYFKVYRNKRNQEMDLIDAPDMDEFEGESDEEEEYDFEEDDEAEKQAFMDNLLSDDSDSSEWDTDAEAEYQNYRNDEEEATDENVYATSHKESTSEEAVAPTDIFSESDEYETEYDEELDGADEEE